MSLGLSVTHWFNTEKPLEPNDFAGRIVVLHAFQMLCPGCVAHGTPQAERLHRMLRQRSDIVVIGLHSVFEHHDAMTPAALKAFIHEYRLTLPIAVDAPGHGTSLPRTMAHHGLRGTPSTLIFDRDGSLVHHGFGQEDDLAIGILIGSLLARDHAVSQDCTNQGRVNMVSGCSDDGCAIPGMT